MFGFRDPFEAEINGKWEKRREVRVRGEVEGETERV